MKVDWLEKYCLEKKGTRKDYKEEWGAYRYLIGEKMFVMHGGDKEGREIISLKLRPENGELFRQEYPGVVVPGYYMNKQHWNSIYTAGQVPVAVLKKMLDESYELILSSFSQKKQREIRGEEKND